MKHVSILITSASDVSLIDVIVAKVCFTSINKIRMFSGSDIDSEGRNIHYDDSS